MKELINPLQTRRSAPDAATPQRRLTRWSRSALLRSRESKNPRRYGQQASRYGGRLEQYRKERSMCEAGGTQATNT